MEQVFNCEYEKLTNFLFIPSRHYNVTAGDIMKPVIKYITTQSTYLQLRDLLKKTTDSSFPLVDKPGKNQNLNV